MLYFQGVFEYNNLLRAGDCATLKKTITMVDYEVTVRTADVLGAGTDGRVYLSLSGDKGSADEVLVSLDGYSSDPESFARGSTFVFTFNGVDVGDNRSITVRLADPEGGSMHSGWNLAAVEVLNKVSGLKGTYNHYDWLPMGGGSVTLSEAVSIQALNAYKVSVTTADQRGAAFDGQAFITINGWNGSTTELLLADPGRATAAFGRGQVSDFTVQSTDVGYLSSITIRMVPSANDPDWGLDSIDVTNLGNGSTASFTYGNRLNTETTSASIYKTVPLTDYSVQVYTSDNGDAGFDGEVLINVSLQTSGGTPAPFSWGWLLK